MTGFLTLKGKKTLFACVEQRRGGACDILAIEIHSLCVRAVRNEAWWRQHQVKCIQPFESDRQREVPCGVSFHQQSLPNLCLTRNAWNNMQVHSWMISKAWFLCSKVPYQTNLPQVTQIDHFQAQAEILSFLCSFNTDTLVFPWSSADANYTDE